MAYDVSKLTNLGQMKSALQRIDTEIIKAKSVRSTATIAVANWAAVQGATNVFKYSDIVTVSAYHFYDLHLDPSTTDTTALMCANADIRAKIESGKINLYCYGTKPTSNFILEIITSPTTTNDVGLSYDIGDDFLVYPSITDALNARVTALESGTSNAILVASNVAIPINRWEVSGDTSYPYKAEITMQHVTSDYYPMVQFSDADSKLYDFSGAATTSAGKVTVLCKTSPSTVVTITNILCYKCVTVTAT